MTRRIVGLIGVTAGLGAFGCEIGGPAAERAVPIIQDWDAGPGSAPAPAEDPDDPARLSPAPSDADKAGTAIKAGDVVINEVLVNPKCVGDTKGEWLELRNRTSADLSLKGWILADDDTDKVVLGEVTLPAGGYLVLCRNPDVATNGGVACQAVGGTYALANTADEVVLKDAAGTVIDRVGYTKAFPFGDGASMALLDGKDAAANDGATAWVRSATAIEGGCGDLGTPGLPNFPESGGIDGGTDGGTDGNTDGSTDGNTDGGTTPTCNPADCDDHNPCTSDGCDAAGTSCIHTANNKAPCDDGNACTTPDTCQDGVCVAGPDTCAAPAKNVVLMVYQDGDNNLDSDAVADLKEMQAANVDSAAWLHVYVLQDRASSSSAPDTRLYQVHSGSLTELAAPKLGLKVGTKEELNMGNPATLSNFIEDVKAIAPAGSDYYLVLWNHGSGWRDGSMADDPATTLKEVCVDDTNGDSLYTHELSSALDGKGLTLIGFDACLMAMAEVAYELRNDARVMVASEETEPGSGWDYTALLTRFARETTPTPQRFGEILVQTYMASASYNDLTMASYDLAAVAALADAATTMAQVLQSVSSSVFDGICNDAEWFVPDAHAEYPHADLYHLAKSAKSRDATHAAAYDAVMKAVDAVVLAEDHESAHPNAHGMAVYFPCDVSLDPAYSATNIRWAADTAWDEMLKNHP